MERTKQEWEEIVGHTIRNDTYQALERIQTGEEFEDIIKDLNQNREKYDIKPETALVSKDTIIKYLRLAGENIDYFFTQKNKEKEILKKYKTKYSHITGYGIYGIFIDNEIIYIGETTDFRTRIKQHYTCFNCSDKSLYVRMREEKQRGKKVSIKPLINVEELVTNEKITQRDIFAMELALITLYKPLYNYEGIKIPYQFSNKRTPQKKFEESEFELF